MISKAAMILFVAGAGIPLMAALNSGLGLRLGSPIPAYDRLIRLSRGQRELGPAQSA